MASTKDEELTHDEIWDDTSLIGSWNDALAEYKKYHSIYTKGGDVHELSGTTSSTAAAHVKDEDEISGPLETQTHAPEADRGEAAGLKGVEGWYKNADQMKNGTAAGQEPAQAPPAQPPAMLPAPLLGPMQDEGMQKLLMSWYYAGYYTGYYQGQREQAQQQ